VIVNEFRAPHEVVRFATDPQVERDGFELGPSHGILTGEKGPEVDHGVWKDAVKADREACRTIEAWRARWSWPPVDYREASRGFGR
jgi:hypothetical protein